MASGNCFPFESVNSAEEHEAEVDEDGDDDSAALPPTGKARGFRAADTEAKE